MAQVTSERLFLSIVFGLPGAGKSEISQRLAQLTEAHRLNTDVVRKQLFPEPSYSPEESQALYAELFSRTDAWLASRESVVLDGTFNKATHRQRVKELAEYNQVPLIIIEVVCNDEELLKHRLQERLLTDNPSQADWAVYQYMKQQFGLARIDEPRLIVENNKQTLVELDELVTQVVLPYIWKQTRS